MPLLASQHQLRHLQLSTQNTFSTHVCARIRLAHTPTTPTLTGLLCVRVCVHMCPYVCYVRWLLHTDKGILGTTDPNQAPPSEALAVGHHPTDEGGWR